MSEAGNQLTSQPGGESTTQAASQAASQPAMQPMRIMVVEDDFIARRLLLAVLTHFGSCDAAVNGQEALDAFRTAWDEGRPYRLMCLDLMMPLVTGYEVLREIRRFEAERGVPSDRCLKVIVTTERADLESVVSAFHVQCEAYLTKPIEKRKLLAKLKELDLIQGEFDLREAEIPGEARKRLGDLFAAWERNFTGQGPTGVRVYADGAILTIVADGFMTTLEKTLAAREENLAFLPDLRRRLLEVETESIRETLAREFGLSVSEVHSHVDLLRNKLIVAVRTSRA